MSPPLRFTCRGRDPTPPTLCSHPLRHSLTAVPTGPVEIGLHTIRLTMLAAAETEAATMVAPATDAGNQFCLNQYQRGAFSWSQCSRPWAVSRKLPELVSSNTPTSLKYRIASCFKGSVPSDTNVKLPGSADMDRSRTSRTFSSSSFEIPLTTRHLPILNVPIVQPSTATTQWSTGNCQQTQERAGTMPRPRFLLLYLETISRQRRNLPTGASAPASALPCLTSGKRFPLC